MNIQHNKPSFDRKEIQITREVIQSNWVAQGAKVKELEYAFCEYLGLPDGHAVALSSGSAALYLALWVLGAKGKKVGLPTYTCAAVRNAVSLLEAKTTFLDTDGVGPNVDLEEANKADLHTLIAVSTYGIPLSVPNKRDFLAVEDFSQALGSEISGVKVGTIGNVGICSLSATKLITSGGQGGMLVSRDKRLIEQVRDYREFDARDDSMSRFNFQMTDLQAGIGVVQLRKINTFHEKRSEIFDLYSSFGINLMRETQVDQVSVRYRAVLRVENPEEIRDQLQRQGIQTIVPITYNELLSKSAKMKNAIKLSQSTLSLPIYPSLRLRDVKKIAFTTQRILGRQ